MAKWLTLKTFGAVCLSLTLAGASTVALAAVGNVLDTASMETTLASEKLLTDVAHAGKRIVAVGERGHIIYSDDNGKQWTQASVPVSMLLTAVYFPTPTQGWAVGHSGVILHTGDAGATWTKQLDGRQEAKMVISQLEQQMTDMQAQEANAPESKKRALQDSLENLKFSLEDAKSDEKVGPWKPLLDVWFRDAKYGFAIGAYGLIFHTDDGGQTWHNWADHVPNPDGYHLNAIAQVKGGALFIAGEAGTVYLSTDDGMTWSSVKSPYGGSFFGALGTGNVNEVLAFGLRGHVFRSDDLGKSWKAVPVDADATLNSGVADGKGRIVLVGNDGSVLVSSDAGQTFRSHVRADREALLSAVLLNNDNLLLVGEQGTELAGPDGTGKPM
ncbi:WD40/YVTN/BNR-like repeat-containing protein [Mangrovitalea sediminis]|uniref:WD40/YVTN/BNR-like repeat-containing protein n=1 Tax=Mangrovitalea sediminis TaxID=1982043 RepID=UPI000BE57801|nr:YCF48-related protein [Mangrovitalea sediminis]